MSQAGYKCDCLQTMQDVMSGFTCHVLDKKAAKSQVIAVEDSDSEFLEPPSAKSPSPVLQKTPDAKDTVEEVLSPEKVTNPRRRLSFSKIAQKVRDLQDMKKASQSGSDDEQQVGEGPRWPGWPQPLQIGGRYFCRAIRLDYPEDEPALEPRDYLLNGPYDCSEEEEEACYEDENKSQGGNKRKKTDRKDKSKKHTSNKSKNDGSKKKPQQNTTKPAKKKADPKAENGVSEPRGKKNLNLFPWKIRRP